MSTSWTRAVRELALPVLLVRLLMILVLSGCSSSPWGRAALAMSPSMAVRRGRVWLVRSTSSAKRKLVSVEMVVNPSRTPLRFFCQSAINGAMMCCRRALKSKELSGSPCLVEDEMGHRLQGGPGWEEDRLSHIA